MGMMQSVAVALYMMTVVIAGLMYLAIGKRYGPLLLLPISFGMLLANLPMAGLMEQGGLLYYLYQGVKLGVYPSLVFLGIGGADGPTAIYLTTKLAPHLLPSVAPLIRMLIGPNVVGVIGSTVAAGVLLTLFGG